VGAGPSSTVSVGPGLSIRIQYRKKRFSSAPNIVPPREVVTHLSEQDCCPDCGEALRNFGEDVAEIVGYIPANFKVIRHVRPKFACTGCERIVKAPRRRA